MLIPLSPPLHLPHLHLPIPSVYSCFHQSYIKQQAERNLNFQTGLDGQVLPETAPIQKVKEFPFEDDAFSTVMQWLYSRWVWGWGAR